MKELLQISFRGIIFISITASALFVLYTTGSYFFEIDDPIKVFALMVIGFSSFVLSLGVGLMTENWRSWFK